jgi:chemotaxis protein methyltransferase CheR
VPRTDPPVSAVADLVATRLGLDVLSNRRPELERSIAAGMRAAGVDAHADYVTWLRGQRTDGPAWRRLAGELTVKETYFFRDPHLHDALVTHVLPKLIAARRAQGTLFLRLWSAGCATGEEPYTLAMLLHRALPDRSNWTLTVLGTDIDGAALEAANRGRYREWSLRETPAWARETHFRRLGGGRFELNPEIRRMVTFAPGNLLDAGHGALDLILCRNVVMYFTPAARRAAVERLKHAVADDGWLALSPAEASAALLRPLRPVELCGALLHAKRAARARTPRPPAPAPSWPARRPSRAQPAGNPLATARAHANDGRLDEALALCRSALRANRLDADAHLLLASVQRERGEPEEALTAARAAVYAAPASPAAHFTLATLLLEAGATDQGRGSMATVTELLDSMPPDRVVADETTAAELLAAARTHLQLAS